MAEFLNIGRPVVTKGVSRKMASKIAKLLRESSVVTNLAKTNPSEDGRTWGSGGFEVAVQVLASGGQRISGQLILTGALAMKFVDGRPTLCTPEEI